MAPDIQKIWTPNLQVIFFPYNYSYSFVIQISHIQQRTGAQLTAGSEDR